LFQCFKLIIWHIVCPEVRVLRATLSGFRHAVLTFSNYKYACLLKLHSFDKSVCLLFVSLIYLPITLLDVLEQKRVAELLESRDTDALNSASMDNAAAATAASMQASSAPARKKRAVAGVVHVASTPEQLSGARPVKTILPSHTARDYLHARVREIVCVRAPVCVCVCVCVCACALCNCTGRQRVSPACSAAIIKSYSSWH
jgi:hypothetical protein